MLLKRPQRPVWEWVLLVTVISVSLLLSAALYARRDSVAKNKMMRWELQAHRQSILAYFLTNKQFPKDLQSALTTAPLRDPFGSPYHYDAKTGWIHSQTEESQHF